MWDVWDVWDGCDAWDVYDGGRQMVADGIPGRVLPACGRCHVARSRHEPGHGAGGPLVMNLKRSSGDRLGVAQKWSPKYLADPSSDQVVSDVDGT